MRLASSSRAVRCRRLPIAYRLLVARSDVAAAKQAWYQSPRGSPRRSRWAGPLGRLNKGQELCFPILLKQHFCRKLFFCGRRLALFGVNCGASRRIHLPSPARPPGAAHRLASRASPPAPLGWRGPPLGACQISFFLAPTWTGEGEGSGLFDAAPRLRFAPCPRPLPFPASGPTGARPLAPFTYGICTRTEQGKKNTGQEQEQKTQNTPFPAVFYNHAISFVLLLR